MKNTFTFVSFSNSGKFLIGIGVCFCLILIAIAQVSAAIIQTEKQAVNDVRVSGRILSNLGQPLAGATVTLKNAGKSTSSDAAGNFALTVPEDAILVISFIGYESLEIKVDGKTQLLITLEPIFESLNEVVVIGYSTQKKKDLTGAVSIINSRDIASIPVGGIDQVMQGKAAGVAITQSSGAPGEGISVNIRGVGSINSNSPLYIIDGIPTTNGINEISPNDIETINILKDASSAAIYGARATNGVVIVTTKRGSSGKAKFNFNANSGVQIAGNLIKMTNTSQYVVAYNTAAQNDGRALIPASVSATLPDVNWLEEVLKPALQHSLNFSVNGGNENSQYIFSTNYFKQDGLIMNSGFDRLNLRTAVNSTLSKYVKVGSNINLSYAKTRQVGSSGDGFGPGNPGASIVRYALFRTPATPVYNAIGQFVDRPAFPNYFGDGLNPVALADSYNKNYNKYAVLGNTFAEVSPINNLKVKSDFGLNLIMTDFKQFNKTFGIDRFWNSTGSLGQSNENQLNYNWTNTALYDLTLREKHVFNFLAGTELIKNKVNAFSASRSNFVSQGPNFQYLDNGSSLLSQNGGGSAHSALFSGFGRVSYQYNNRFLASVNFRRDGSSRLNPAKRYGNFYSGSVGWKVDQEEFMKNIRQITTLKLRASMGQLGNQEIGNYSYISLIKPQSSYPFGGVATQGSSIFSKGNPNVLWETSTQTNIGLDLGLFNNSLTLTADYYIKNTSDLLIKLPEPSSAGEAEAPYVNAGKAQNKGLEMDLNYQNSINTNWNYSVGGNVAFLHNEMISLAGGSPLSGARIDNQYFATLTAVGHPIGAFYLLQQEGIFQNASEVFSHAFQGPGIVPGDVKYKDVNGDGIISENDRTFVGSPLPKFTYGFTGNVQYKSLDLNLFFQGVSGNKLYNQILTDIEGFYRPFNLTERVATGSWTGEGSSNTFPRLSWTGASNNKRPSTRFLEDGSYLRLKNIQLGYTLKRKVLSHVGMSSVRIYASGQNLLTFTKYTGLDPEMYTNNNSAGEGARAVGIDWGTYPSARTFTIGLNANF